MSEKGILLVTTRPSSPDRDAEFNDWYDNTHLPEVVACDGFRAARRYSPVKVSTVPNGVPAAIPEDDNSYVAVYDLEADDLDAAVQAMFQKVSHGQLNMSDSLQNDPAPKVQLLRQTIEEIK